MVAGQRNQLIPRQVLCEANHAGLAGGGLRGGGGGRQRGPGLHGDGGGARIHGCWGGWGGGACSLYGGGDVGGVAVKGKQGALLSGEAHARGVGAKGVAAGLAQHEAASDAGMEGELLAAAALCR